jgi:RNA polymerase sigma-70 factor (ECF subfamily)
MLSTRSDDNVLVLDDDVLVLDEDLASISGSDLTAFSQLYERYEKRIHRYLRKMTKDEAAAEDLTAYVFFRAFRSAHTFRRDGSYGAWIFRIARNAANSWHSDRLRSDIPVETIPERSDPQRSYLTEAIVEEEREVVRRTIADLPQAQREVLDLRYWQDLSVDEIATRTMRSAVAVRQLLFRARRALGRRLSPNDVAMLLGAAAGASAVAAISYRNQRKGHR